MNCKQWVIEIIRWIYVLTLRVGSKSPTDSVGAATKLVGVTRTTLVAWASGWGVLVRAATVRCKLTTTTLVVRPAGTGLVVRATTVSSVLTTTSWNTNVFGKLSSYEPAAFIHLMLCSSDLQNKHWSSQKFTKQKLNPFLVLLTLIGNGWSVWPVPEIINSGNIISCPPPLTPIYTKTQFSASSINLSTKFSWSQIWHLVRLPVS